MRFAEWEINLSVRRLGYVCSMDDWSKAVQFLCHMIYGWHGGGTRRGVDCRLKVEEWRPGEVKPRTKHKPPCIYSCFVVCSKTRLILYLTLNPHPHPCFSLLCNLQSPKDGESLRPCPHPHIHILETQKRKTIADFCLDAKKRNENKKGPSARMLFKITVLGDGGVGNCHNCPSEFQVSPPFHKSKREGKKEQTNTNKMLTAVNSLPCLLSSRLVFLSFLKREPLGGARDFFQANHKDLQDVRSHHWRLLPQTMGCRRAAMFTRSLGYCWTRYVKYLLLFILLPP